MKISTFGEYFVNNFYWPFDERSKIKSHSHSSQLIARESHRRDARVHAEVRITSIFNYLIN